MKVATETPAMAQYRRAKERYPDALLFFRMGDFYEMFFDDAKLASDTLGLTLTARDKAKRIPMAGVPVKAATGYMQRLLDRGIKVAVCEQIGDPKLAKGVVEREVVRVLTPGTLTEDASLDPSRSNFLCAIRLPRPKDRKQTVGLAWVDCSTGRFLVSETDLDGLQDELARIAPAEVLLADDADGAAWRDTLRGEGYASVTLVPPWTLDSANATKALREHLAVASLRAFGLDRAPAARAAAGAALEYLRETQKASLAHVTHIETHEAGDTLRLERTTRRRLDLVPRPGQTAKGTLIGVLDRTRTAMGARTLREWLLAPLTNRERIEARHDGVEEFVKDGFLRRDLREALKAVRDIERILGRVATGRANARDLLSLGQSLDPLPPIRAMLGTAYSKTLAGILARIEGFEDLGAKLGSAITDEPPQTLTEGGMIREGYSAELDELHALSQGAKTWIAEYQASESARTGIPSLKIGFNKVFGYYLEVTNTHKDKVPPEYRRKQTLTNAERYVTEALDEYEKKVLRADDQAKALEHRLLTALRSEVATHIPALQRTAAAMAELDALASLAEVAEERGYVRPDLHDDRGLDLRDGRHPVVEAALDPGERFVPNDTRLDAEQRVGLITGPNMAGKSTYIRQTALLVLMAQMGSFVPATSARVGLCDRIFTRVGADDDLAAGQSTFMVEMSEAAYILRHATNRSLVVLDEVGRGTSTYDGIAIAWALTEYLSEVVGARTLFATHYHELTQLADELSGVRNLNVGVREWGDDIVFLHRIQEGATDRSYGIHVARLAGVPEAVVERARAMLRSLESERSDSVERIAFGTEPARPQDVQLGLFTPAAPDPVLDELRDLDLDTLSPLDALNRLAAWQSALRERPS